MPRFINPGKSFPICDYVVYHGRIIETVIVPIPDGRDHPVYGGAGAHMREICRQLDEVLAHAGANRRCVVSVQLFLQHVRRDIAAVNQVYRDYFAGCSPMRMAVGADLQSNMLVEAAIRIELPARKPRRRAKPRARKR